MNNGNNASSIKHRYFLQKKIKTYCTSIERVNKLHCWLRQTSMKVICWMSKREPTTKAQIALFGLLIIRSTCEVLIQINASYFHCIGKDSGTFLKHSYTCNICYLWILRRGSEVGGLRFSMIVSCLFVFPSLFVDLWSHQAQRPAPANSQCSWFNLSLLTGALRHPRNNMRLEAVIVSFECPSCHLEGGPREPGWPNDARRSPSSWRVHKLFAIALAN